MSGKWIEVFKAGNHTTMDGKAVSYAVEDVRRIVDKFNESGMKAPIVLGHPKIDDPAYGWVSKLKEVGGTMLAYAEYVTDKVKEAVDKGMFRNVSIALVGDRLRHVGLLGAALPAVEGLAPVKFGADERFETFTMDMQAGGREDLFTAIKDFLKEFIGSEMKGKPKQEDDMDETKLKEMFAAQGDAMKATFAEMLKPITEEITALKTASEENGRKIAEQGKELSFASGSRDFASFCDGLVASGQVLAAERDALIDEYADLLKAESVMQFASGEKPLTVKFRERLSARPKASQPSGQWATPDRAKPKTATGREIPVEFASMAGDVMEDSVVLDAEIQEYAAKHNVSYEEAVTRIIG